MPGRRRAARPSDELRHRALDDGLQRAVGGSLDQQLAAAARSRRSARRRRRRPRRAARAAASSSSPTTVDVDADGLALGLAGPAAARAVADDADRASCRRRS